jgi:two-component system, NarL family, sensor kinase
LENKDQVDITTLIVLATMGMLIIIFFIIIFVILHQKKMLAHDNTIIENESKHQKNLLESSLYIAESEREKIAANIHDDIGMMLNVLKLNLNRAQKNLDNKILVDEIFINSYSILDNSLEAIRSISNELLPPTLNKLGFIKGIREVCRQINLSGLVEMSMQAEVQDIKIDKRVEVQLYRLVKEIIHNTIKHTRASHIDLDIKIKLKILCIIISHNGKGINTDAILSLAESSSGLGLKSILTRSQIIEARVEYMDVKKQNPLVVIELPLK